MIFYSQFPLYYAILVHRILRNCHIDLLTCLIFHLLRQYSRNLIFDVLKKYVYYHFKGKEYYHYEFTKTILAYIA